ncbi:MAG: cell division protein FtsZ [Candidatus Diapherotrites archaeon]|uniref:Cell division protein FtsZ n=1 Tax=Candidatus Iainarchaeum sp. TaxID=3101447 RepID=A0A2D6M113_9ARCH|nr:cell division protein FtsZ [Candidatus Diapherotrites archaeon]|tara:strand:- start:10965 stop:12089 length:1125 start_codon:yes stop_codon:yes gene_type:complete
MESIVKKAVKRAKAGKAKVPKGKKTIGNDEELVKLLETAQAKIRVVGVGGGGGNTITRMTEVGITGAETLAVNTDAQDLLKAVANKKMLIGKELTRGLGSGSDPSVGEGAARESIEDLTETLSDADLVFITCGMGGGTGTGAAPTISEIAKEVNALTIGVVTLPFTVEGRKRMENALHGLGNLRKNCDTVIVIPNDKILEIAPDLPVNAAFKVADEVLTNAVKGITEMVTKPGLINLDYADLKTILSRGGAAMIGLGESRGDENGEARALEAVENALTSPLLDVDISGANRALVNVIGGTDMTLREAEMIVETVSAKISSNAHIIWGAMIDDNMPRNQIQAMVVIAGGKFPYLDGDVDKMDLSEPIDLGIEFTG